MEKRFIRHIGKRTVEYEIFDTEPSTGKIFYRDLRYGSSHEGYVMTFNVFKMQVDSGEIQLIT